MQKFGRGVVKLRVPILIVSVLLLIPSIFGFVSTRINYDILSYLPSDIETMKGQDIMLDEFGKGGCHVYRMSIMGTNMGSEGPVYLVRGR